MSAQGARETSESPAICRVPAAAAETGVTPRVFYCWLVKGIIPAHVWFRSGRAVYVRLMALRLWLAGRDPVKAP